MPPQTRAIDTSSVKALAVVQRRTTPGAPGLVIVTSGKVGPNSDSTTAAIAAEVMQWAHGYSGCSGVSISGSQSATGRMAPLPLRMAVIGRQRLYVYLASNTAM